MAYSLMKSLTKSVSPCAYISSSSLLRISHRSFAKKTSSSEVREQERVIVQEPEPGRIEDDDVPTSGICRPLSEILKELNKRVPDSLVRIRMEDGFSIKYVPWHIVNRIMNLHAPEWSGDVRSITYSADGKSVSVVYRVTLYGTDAEVEAKQCLCKANPQLLKRTRQTLALGH